MRVRKERAVRVFEDGGGAVDVQRDGVRFEEVPRRVAGRREEDANSGTRVVSASHAPTHRSDPLEQDTKAVDTIRAEMARLRKEPRRRTIYVPSEDTTILTIHPGVRADMRTTRSCGLRNGYMQHSHLVQNDIERGVTGPRISLATAPKRVPLQSTLKVVQECVSEIDRVGNGGGKENIPPSSLELFEFGKGKAPCVTDKAGLKPSQKQVRLSPKTVRMVTSKTTALQPKSVRQIAEKPWAFNRAAGPHGKCSTIVDEHVGSFQLKSRRNIISCVSLESSRSPTFPEVLPKLPTRLAPVAIPTTIPVLKPQYRLLQEDISRPELFEDTWLSDQESAITQIVNGLFDAASPRTSRLPGTIKTRRQFLDLYEEPSMVLLHKRLQASLLYGALRIPKDSLAEVGRLTTDIGLRRRFMELWTKSYDMDALISAVEVVVGREVPSHPLSSMATSMGDQPSKKRRRELERFLDACLLQNEDLQKSHQTPSHNSTSSNLWPSQDPKNISSNWLRTTLRSLMLIILLDRVKQTSLGPSKLFRKDSPHKSSHAILLELSNLLLSSLGDPTRTLAHLDYHLLHTQIPLDEYAYPIQNLAIDLRDGVRLTHLVELLLYPPATLQAQKEDVTITMPTGETLTSAFDQGGESWVLSQHLKFPCLGRVQKMYNVQITLSALQGVKGIEHVLDGLKAEDIIDGHREKSIKLLWGLVGKYGLATLVDFEDLRREIQRLQNMQKKWRQEVVDEEEEADERESPRYQTALLYAWARAVAAKHSVNVSNLTTSFADGNIFSKIVEEYSRYFPFSPTQSLSSSVTSKPNFSASTRNALDNQLRNIGCSTSFASLFSPGQGSKVFDKDFTIAALAFLASRLLGGSGRGRAGCVIWSAWKGYQNRKLTRRKCVLRGLARDCAMVLQTREKIEKAARCLQRSVRMWLTRRGDRRRLEEEWAKRLEEVEVKDGMLDLQSRIRGWAARRGLDEVDIWLC